MKPLTIILLCLAALTISGCGDKKPASTKLIPLGGNCRLDDGKLILAADQTECEDYYKGTWEDD